MDIRRENTTKYIVLREAARIFGYAADYIGYLIRKGKVEGKRVYTNVSWQIAPEVIIKYCLKMKNLEIRDSFLLKKKSLSLKEAAVISGYTPDYIGSLIRKGELVGKKVYSGVSWMVNEEDIKKYQEKIEAQKLKSTKNWEVLKFVSDFFPPIRIPVKIQESTKNISGNQNYQTKRLKVFGFSWRVVLTFIILLSLLGIGPLEILQKIVGALTEEERTINFYSTLCEGNPPGGEAGWQNPENAQGQPDVDSSGDLDSFSESNSAIYKGGSLNLVCQNFEKNSEEIKDEDFVNLKIQSAKIKLSLAIGEKKPDLEIPKSSPEEPVLTPPEESVPMIPEGSPAENIEEPALLEEEPLPPEETGEIETAPDFVPTPEATPPVESSPPVETTTSPTSLFKQIKNLFSVAPVEAEEGNIIEEENTVTEEVISPTEELPTEDSTPTPDGALSPIETDISPEEEILTPNLDSRIIIWYSLDNETWWQLADISQQPISNFSNGGYFSYEAPFLKTFEDVKNLKIKIEGVKGNETAEITYLDSVFVELNCVKEQKEEIKTEKPKKILKVRVRENSLLIPELKKDFSVNESPTFLIEEPEISPEELVRNGKAEIIEEAESTQDNQTEETQITGILDKAQAAIGEAVNTIEEAVDTIKEKILEPVIEETVLPPEVEAQETSITEPPISNDKNEVKVKIFGPDGSELNISPEVNPVLKDGKEAFEIKIPKLSPVSFRPGIYRLEAEFKAKKAIYLISQEFSWGVLAINTNKSIYLPGEEAYLQMAVLGDDGHTNCDANLKLEIISPTGESSSPEIQKSGECGPSNVTDVPDYFTYYQVGEPGIYEMKLKNLDNSYEIKDSFEVRESVPFDIERIGPTRIFPPATYEMKMKIKANQDFQGQVIEKVPASFEIIETSDKRQETRNEEKLIIWDVNWKKGETYELSYQFDAPDISPFLYLLGPLEIGQFQEARLWQIAVDTITISGFLYQNEGTVPYLCASSANRTIYVQVNGAGSYSGICTLDTGAYSVANVTIGAGGDVITVYVESYAVTVTRAANTTSNISDLDLYANRLIVRHEDAGPITNTNLEQYDKDDNANIFFDSDLSGTYNLILDANKKIVVRSGSTFTPGGDVTTPAMRVAGTFNAGSYTLTLSAGGTYSTTCIQPAWTTIPLCITGTFNANTGTTNFTGTAATKIAAATYYILNIGDTGTTATYTANGNITVNSVLTIVSSSGTNTFDASSYTITFPSAGNSFTINSGEIFTANTSTVNYTGALTGGLDVAITPTTYYNLGVGTTADSIANLYYLNGAVTVNNALTIGNASSTNNDTFNTNGNYSVTSKTISITSGGILTAGGSTITITGTGTPFTISGTFNYNTSTVAYTGATTATNITSATYYNLNIGGADTTTTYTAAGDITVTHVLTIVSSSGTNTFNASTKTITLSGTTGTPFVNNETFTHSTSTVDYTGANAGGNTNVVATDYWNLTLTAADTFDSNANTEVSNVFTIGGSATFDGKDDTLTLSGTTGTPFVKTGTFTHSTSTVDYTGANAGGNTNVVATDYWNLTLTAADTFDSNANTEVSNVFTIGGSATFDGKDDTLTLSGTTGTPFVKTGTFTHSTSTVDYTGANAGGNTNVVATDYWNLTLTAADTFDSNANTEVSNVFTIGGSATFDGKDDTLTLSGTTGTPFVKTGTFTPNASTVKYTGNGDTNITAAEYNNLEFSPTITVSNKTYTGAGAITVGGTLNINPTASSALSLTFILGDTTSVTGLTTIQKTGTDATSLLDTKSGSNYTFNTGSLLIKAGGTLNGRASALDSNGDVTIEASGTLTSTSGNFNVGGSWLNSATGTFTHSSGTVIFDAITSGKTISDGGDPFYNISFTGTNGGWTYTDSSATASCDGGSCPKQTTVSATSGTVTYINAKTGTVSVTFGTLNVDWYLGIHVVDKFTTSTDINTGDNDITISENSASPGPYSTVWRYNSGTFGEDGTVWEPATQKNTGTLSTGKNPQPFKVGAIRIREYSMTNSSTCNQANNFAGCTIYKYNLQIAEQENYSAYDYYLDY
jgi:hypothetical protein